MVTMMGAARRLRAALRGHSFNTSGKVNHDGFNEVIAQYRSRGARIGEKVRLLGHIDGINPHLITIGDYAVIGGQSALLTHCPLRGPLPVTIGRFTYLGFGVLILPGVTIGDHCLVGAGAVVARSMPAGSVIVGNPARILRALTQDEQDRIENTMREDRLFGWDPNRPA